MELSKKQVQEYNIITLNPKLLLETGNVKKDEETGNYKIAFSYDFQKNAFSRKRMILSTDTYNSNALFYQMEKILRKSDSPWDEDSLREYIVYLDFTDLFSFFKDEKAEEKTQNKEDLNKALADQSHNKDVLLKNLFNNGFTIVFDNGTEAGKKTHFVPFDKSASMSRTCRISFIDSSIKEELDSRLLLGFNELSSIELISSKFFAYRGLYLTDAHRINLTGDLKINEETVIVIKDDHHNVTANIKNETITMFGDDKDGITDENGTFWTLHEYPSDHQGINPFDGEGLISPDFSDLINKQLDKKYAYSGKYDQNTGRYDREASSYQVRMPFTKGMLHKVDFNGFFSEYVSDEETLYIQDYFGIRRDIRKAKIILTESMFKCCKWLKEVWEKSHSSFSLEEDPMKAFFNNMLEFDHSLYVGNTDVVLGNSSRTKLNYQFLNTLDISSDDFDKLVSSHADQIGKVLDEMRSSIDTDEEIDMTGESVISYEKPWIAALKKNSGFISTKKIKTIIEGTKETLRRNCAIGRLDVSGECRFLSCDLLALLIFIGKNLYTNNNVIDIDKLRKTDCLYSDRFYMACPQIPLFSKRHYALFRSPHLSRNEQCLLRPYITEKGNVYEKYFSHLSGVLMVSRNTLVPMILSGADFDGDLVKIVSEKTVVSAVEKGAYKKTEEGITRKLPIVNIPNTKELSKKSSPNKSISYKTIKNTFSNRIGEISNLAITAGKKEYFDNDKAFKNLSAECTIVTGLEIDAAKTGVHPTRNIENIRNKIDVSEKSYFLKKKSDIVSLRRDRDIKVSADGQEIKLEDGSTRLELKQNKDCSDTPNLDKLPQYFAELESIKKTEKLPSSKKRLFTFQIDDKSWDKKLDQVKKEKTEELMYAYEDILKFSKRLKNARINSDRNYIDPAFFILKVQYDDMEQPLPKSVCKTGKNITPKQALDFAYSLLDKHLRTIDDVMSALSNLIESKWHLTPTDQRASVLRNIVLWDDSEDLPDEVVSLLTNFSNGGYNLLYFILKDLYGAETKNLTPEKYEDIDSKQSNKGQTIISDYYKELFDVYCELEHIKAATKTWQKRIILICREKLREIFNNDLDETIKYVYTIKVNTVKGIDTSFFWDVLPKKTILDNICFAEENNENVR